VGELSSSKEDMEWGSVSILSLRKSAGMTQVQLAAWLGVTVKQVKHLEHQRRNPSGPASRLLDILAQQLGMGDDGRVQVLGADIGPAPEQVVEQPASASREMIQERKVEEVREASPGDRSGAFVWE
jgi:transcriptional regulator with XRE-family HTH domain